jgi:urease accessory protein
MTSHWSPQRPRGGGDVGSVKREVSDGRFELAFLRHGARTAIGRQFVSYPFHLTRPFALDAAIPSLLTVYQQSSSGGLYRAERLACRYEVGRAAAAHVTTQAATVVHDCHGQPARQTVEIALEEDAFLALTPDPLVLFPGAFCVSRLEAKMAPGAVLLLADSFALHDPEGAARPFDRLASDVVVRDTGGRLLVRDCFRVAGDALAGSVSPVGGWRVVSSFLLLGDAMRLPAREELVGLAGDDRAIAGVTPLPNGAGWGVRCLAADAVAARRVGELLFFASVRAAFGSAPARRRK